VIPGKEKRMAFKDTDGYLDFFENVLVRHSKSKYQIDLAERYSTYVRKAPDPLGVPLLIPELRYQGRDAKHKYRLDFPVIDPATMQKRASSSRPGQVTANWLALRERPRKRSMRRRAQTSKRK